MKFLSIQNLLLHVLPITFMHCQRLQELKEKRVKANYTTLASCAIKKQPWFQFSKKCTSMIFVLKLRIKFDYRKNKKLLSEFKTSKISMRNIEKKNAGKLRSVLSIPSTFFQR